MKVFMALFLLLTIINLPVLLMLHSNAGYINYADLNRVFGFFTIGSIGLSEDKCDYSALSFSDERPSRQLNLTCPDSKYISEIKHFGFL